MASTHPYSCLTCSLGFASSTAQRQHFSADLHRYNAKRKVANLGPVTAEVFNDKIAERRDKIQGVAGPSTAEGGLSCKACNKTFSNENVHQDHLRSKKHKEKVLHGVKNIQVDGLVKPAAVEDENMGQAGAAESSSSSSAMPKLDANSCLFCPRTFSDLETNLKHMGHNHSFYVPDLAYCVDIPGLLAHLGQDIALGNICIFCHHGFGGLVTGNETDSELVKRARRGLESVRKHMTDKGHCRLAFETDAERLEVSDYYDYRSSYPDAADHPDSDEEELMDQDWEDEDGSEVDENDEVIMDYSAVRRKTRTAKDEDLDMRRQIGENDYELVLPNGQRVGHRALRGIYKQNLMPHINVDEPTGKVAKLAAALDARQSRRQQKSSALVPTRGGTGGEEGALVHAKNAGEARNAQRPVNEQIKGYRTYQQQYAKVWLRGNNQKHYRDHLLQ